MAPARRALLLAAALFCPSASAAPRDGNLPEDAIRGALQRVADRMAAKYKMSLAATFYAPAGSVSVAAGFTDAGLGLGEPRRRAAADDLYVWGSTTKMFTAPAVLQLVERGHVGLSDPISRHVDPILLQLNGTRLRDYFGDRIDEVHVEHLLHMTSGINDYDKGPFTAAQFANRTKAFGPVEIIGKFVDPELDFAPGTKQSYSSTNYILLGLILARHYHHNHAPWSWQSYDQMSVIPESLRSAFARSEFAMQGPCSKFTPVHGFMEFYPGSTVPEQDAWNVSCVGGWTAGNFIGPVSDIARFTYELYNLKQPSIVSSTSQARMIDFSAPSMMPGMKFKFYGMGTFSLDWSVGQGEEAYGHVGDTYGYQSQTTYFPARDFVVSVATNVETRSQAQPADFTCSAFHEIMAAMQGTEPPACRFKVFGRFIGRCLCSREIVV